MQLCGFGRCTSVRNPVPKCVECFRVMRRGVNSQRCVCTLCDSTLVNGRLCGELGVVWRGMERHCIKKTVVLAAMNEQEK